MRSLRYLVCGASLVVSLVGVSSASAANWDPPGVARTATAGATALTDAGGTQVSCTSADATLTASGAVASGPAPKFNGPCTGPLGAASVTTFGTWHFIAVDTTHVTATATPATAGGPVAQLHLGLGCIVSINGEITVTGNTWNNTTHQLVVNTAGTFPLSANANCLGLVQSPGHLHGTFTLPSDVKIT
jgi:hypothetical protein